MKKDSQTLDLPNISREVSGLPRVFIVQDPPPKRDGWTPPLDGAAKYGALHYVFGKTDRAEPDPEAAMEKIEEELRDFNPEHDYLLPMIFGDPATTWCTLLWLGVSLYERGFDTVRFLYWSRGKDENGRMSNDNGYYKPLTISF